MENLSIGNGLFQVYSKIEEYKSLIRYFENVTKVLFLEEISIGLVTDKNESLAEFRSFNFKEALSSFNDLNKYKTPTIVLPTYSLRYGLILSSSVIDMMDLAQIANSIVDSIDGLMNYEYSNLQDYHHLLTYLDSIDDGISACDSNGIVKYINSGACGILNSTKEEILNQDLNTFISNSILVKVLNDKKAYIDKEYVVDIKSKSIQLINSAYPVYDCNNSLIGAIDVYKRKKRSIKLASDLMGHNANYVFNDFIGESKNLKDSIDIAKKFAKSDKNVLIIGESGTGKELFAQAIHNYSLRNDGPFVAINCASYPRDLFESELFGYDEGAFTGAKKGGKIGKFEFANGGTIFLDEIGEMPLNLQAKLLRIIESRSLSRIGSNKNTDIDVRIIAATNRNLEEMVRKGTFREDLFYRLKVLYLELPPLRERDNDIIYLCDYFIDKLSQDSHKEIIGLDEGAKKLVLQYEWPGNIREVENVISLALFYCSSNFITKDNLIRAGLSICHEDIHCGDKSKNKLSLITKEVILKTLKDNNGNKKKTAEMLGISRNTIYRTLKD